MSILSSAMDLIFGRAARDPGVPSLEMQKFADAHIRKIRNDTTLHHQRMMQAWKAYKNIEMETFTNIHQDSRAIFNLDRDNIRLGYCAMLVHKAMQFITGTGIAVHVVPKLTGDMDLDTEQKITPPKECQVAQAWLTEYLREAKFQQILQGLCITGGITGQFGFLRLRMRQGKVVLSVIDPILVEVYWTPGDNTDIIRYVITQEQDRTGLNTQVLTQVIQRVDGPDGTTPTWEIRDYIGSPSTPLSGNPVAFDPWPYPFPPILASQYGVEPGQYWGRPIIDTTVIESTRSSNSIASHATRITRIFSAPKMVGNNISTHQMEKINWSDDELIAFPNADATIKPIVWDSASLDGAMRLLNFNGDHLLRVGGLPMVATGNLEHIGNLTGVSIKLLFQPALMAGDEKKSGTIGGLLEDLFLHLLIIENTENRRGWNTDAMKFSIVWPNVLPIDDLNEAQVAQIKAGLGLSRHTNLSNLGEDPAMETMLNAKVEDPAVSTPGPYSPPAVTTPV